MAKARVRNWMIRGYRDGSLTQEQKDFIKDEGLWEALEEREAKKSKGKKVEKKDA